MQREEVLSLPAGHKVPLRRCRTKAGKDLAGCPCRFAGHGSQQVLLGEMVQASNWAAKPAAWWGVRQLGVFALPRGLTGRFQLANKAGRGCRSKQEVSAHDPMHAPPAPVPAGDKEQRFPRD